MSPAMLHHEIRGTVDRRERRSGFIWDTSGIAWTFCMCKIGTGTKDLVLCSLPNRLQGLSNFCLFASPDCRQ